MNDIGQVFVDYFGIDLEPDEAHAEAVVVHDVPPPPPSEQLPIDEYDSQAAAQIIKLLVQLTPEELDQIEAYEQENRNRVTICRKIEQLRKAG